MWAGPYALIFLLFFPLPSVPIGVVAIPVFMLSLTVIREVRRQTREGRQPTTSGL
jgi:hypothetical protein